MIQVPLGKAVGRSIILRAKHDNDVGICSSYAIAEPEEIKESPLVAPIDRSVGAGLNLGQTRVGELEVQ